MTAAGSATVAANLADADKLIDMNATPGVVAHGGPVHEDPSALGLTGTAFVSLAMIAVIVLMLWKKVPTSIGATLDKRIATIREQLAAASTLRAEAEALKAEYEARSAAAAGEAEAIRAGAQEEAAAILTRAQAEAADLVERRGRMAEDKIAAAERAALDEVRATVVAAATAAAGRVIAEQHNVEADRTLVNSAIQRVGRFN